MRVAQRRSRCICFLLVLVVWGVPELAYAQDLSDFALDNAPTKPTATFRDVSRQATTGEPVFQSFLGSAYTHGWWGVTPDAAVSVRWHTLAAEQGIARSQEQLGAAYGLGRGVLIDHLQAYKWTALAASRLSGEEFDRVSKARDSLVDLLPDSQLNAANRIAKDWKPSTFEEAKEVIIALPPLDGNCRDAWTEMIALLFEGKCLPGRK